MVHFFYDTDDCTSIIQFLKIGLSDFSFGFAEPEEVFRFEPLFGRTPLAADANNQILMSEVLSVSIPFKPVNPIASFAALRQSMLYSWVFIAFIVALLVTEIMLDFQNSFWWLLAYMPPLFLFMAIEFTQADLSSSSFVSVWLGFHSLMHLIIKTCTGMVKVLFWSFESWLIWVNLLLMLIFAEIGAYFSGVAVSPEHTLLNNLTVVLGGFFVTTFDAFKVPSSHSILDFFFSKPLLFIHLYSLPDPQRSKFTWRLHMSVLLVLLFAIARVVIKDQFYEPVFLEYGPVCLLYCSDTRQLAMSCARTALIFVWYVSLRSKIMFTLQLFS
jgi:hypothetical protein